MQGARPLLIRGGTVVPLTQPGTFFTGDVMSEGDRITHVGSDLAMEPADDPAAMVVFTGDAGSVRHVVIDGKVVVEDGILASGEKSAIRGEARAATAAVSARLGWT